MVRRIDQDPIFLSKFWGRTTVWVTPCVELSMQIETLTRNSDQTWGVGRLRLNNGKMFNKWLTLTTSIPSKIFLAFPLLTRCIYCHQLSEFDKKSTSLLRPAVSTIPRFWIVWTTQRRHYFIFQEKNSHDIDFPVRNQCDRNGQLLQDNHSIFYQFISRWGKCLWKWTATAKDSNTRHTNDTDSIIKAHTAQLNE